MRFLFLIAFVLLYTLSFAQVQHSGWLASFNTFKLDKKWSVHFDAQLRTTDDLKQIQTIILRPGINYHLTKQLMVTAGYAYIPARRTISGATALLTEHRAWQQLLYNHKIFKIATAHRLRFEQRYLPQPAIVNNELQSTDFRTAFRLRYFVRSIIPLVRKPAFTEGLFAAIQNEAFINTGNKTHVNGRTFDQNRLYLAVGYRLPNSKIDLEAGYLNQYIRGRNNAFTNNHIAQLAVYKRL